MQALKLRDILAVIALVVIAWALIIGALSAQRVDRAQTNWDRSAQGVGR